MMSPVLSHKRAAVGVESKLWLVIFSHFRDFSILFAFRSRCLSVFLAGTTVQRLSSCDKASSSMHLGEVPSNELTHLDEEVAYISHMNWR